MMVLVKCYTLQFNNSFLEKREEKNITENIPYINPHYLTSLIFRSKEFKVHLAVSTTQVTRHEGVSL